jgi:hypothetical protein
MCIHRCGVGTIAGLRLWKDSLYCNSDNKRKFLITDGNANSVVSSDLQLGESACAAGAVRWGFVASHISNVTCIFNYSFDQVDQTLLCYLYYDFCRSLSKIASCTDHKPRDNTGLYSDRLIKLLKVCQAACQPVSSLL